MSVSMVRRDIHKEVSILEKSLSLENFLLYGIQQISVAFKFSASYGILWRQPFAWHD